MSEHLKRMGRWLAIAVLIGWVCASPVAAQKGKPPKPGGSTTYKTVWLSSNQGWASATNQLADGVVEVVGMIRDNSGASEIRRAHYWMVEPAGNVLLSINLETLPPVLSGATVHSDALDVNNHGVVVGSQSEETDVLVVRPVLWPSGADAPIALPLPAGAVWGNASSINDAGIVVGTVAYSVDVKTLVAWKVAVVDGLWTVQDTQIILDTNTPGLMSAHVVNSGYVCTNVAVAPTAPWDYRAYRLKLAWDGEQVWEVPDSRTQLFNVYSTANGINEQGTVCGSYNDGRSRAFVMNAAGNLLTLPQLPGGRIGGQQYEVRNCVAYGLNNASPLQAVGLANIVITKTSEMRGDVGVLWNVGGSAVDLDAATSQDVTPYDINDGGWIAANAVETQSPQRHRPIVLIPSQ
jgi:hypothetical protein